ncbi:Tetratricopeptide repeat protein 1 [Psilocybe cubensis]|uniref:TPR-like protein n=2 Tax=Psilocybe cubensis TaxID=181762 RepID=A0A8H7Y7J2_PSICU|nr:Tetratricopeptide repeat protein 1 [Psilocybe cubensis]KAH9486748.1 Tetratricopeptide repeat protein 1 [Psilocybe cubensis]
MSSKDNDKVSQETPLEEDYLEVANERKQEGNDHFRAGKWNEALVAYRSALNCLPKRPASPRAEKSQLGEDDEGGEPEPTPDLPKAEEDVIDLSSPAVSEVDKEAARLRAVLNANMGACFVKLGDHKEAVKLCTEAIRDDPTYIKARERRAASNDALNTWTSLTSVQEDYEALLKLIDSPSQQSDIRRKLQLLKPRLEAAQKRETDEMLGKLKSLGNSILGNFGLSTDNFKFEPNGSGGYSMNFTR